MTIDLNASLTAAWRRVSWSLAVLLLWLPVCQAGADIDTAAIRFDIPAQSLGTALKAYTRQSGVGVLIDSAYTQRHGAFLQGSFTARQGLLRLLQGTGLVMKPVSAKAVAIVAGDPDAAQPASISAPAEGRIALASIDGMDAGNRDWREFVAHLQTVVVRTLCRSILTRPGAYRLAVQVRIDATGKVQHARLLGSTGVAQRDRAIVDALRLSLGQVPPADMPQPVTLLLRPEGNGVSAHCHRAEQGAMP